MSTIHSDRFNEPATKSGKWHVLDMPESKEMTDKRLVKQPTCVACVSEDLMCWRAWDTTCGHKAKDITPERCRNRKRSMIFLERTRKGHCQSDQYWNCFKRNTGETHDRWGGVHMGFPECIDTILNWSELNMMIIMMLTTFLLQCRSRLAASKTNRTQGEGQKT